MPLFEVAIIEKYKEDKKNKERLVLGPQAVIAKDAQGAALAVAMGAKEEIKADPADLEVLVRPFAS